MKQTPTHRLHAAVLRNRFIAALSKAQARHPTLRGCLGILLLIGCSVSLVYGANRAVTSYATNTARAEARRLLAKGDTVTLRSARLYWFQAKIAVMTDDCDLISVPTQNPFFNTLADNFIATAPYRKLPLKVRLSYQDEPIWTDRNFFPAVGESGSHLNFEVLEDSWGKPPETSAPTPCAWPDEDR